jgi:hypothetical protein
MCTTRHHFQLFTTIDQSRTAAESAACIEATVQAVKAARAREREKRIRDEKLRQQVSAPTFTIVRFIKLVRCCSWCSAHSVLF